VDSLLEAVSKAAEIAVSGDVVLLSPACSSFDMFQNYQHRGAVFRHAVEHWISATGGGPAHPDTTNGVEPPAPLPIAASSGSRKKHLATEFLEGKPRGENIDANLD
jgi:hypothetical protein